MITYLLTNETDIDARKRVRHTEYVLRYEDREMAEIFTADERAALNGGRTVTKRGRLGQISTYVDMIVAARKVVTPA